MCCSALAPRFNSCVTSSPVARTAFVRRQAFVRPSLRRFSADSFSPAPPPPQSRAPKPQQPYSRGSGTLLPEEELSYVWDGYNGLQDRLAKTEHELYKLRITVSDIETQLERAKRETPVPDPWGAGRMAEGLGRLATMWAVLVAVNLVGTVARFNTSFFVPLAVVGKSSPVALFYSNTLPHVVVPILNTLVVTAMLVVPLVKELMRTLMR